MADGVAENGGCHDGQKNYIYININNTIHKNMVVGVAENGGCHGGPKKKKTYI